MDDSIPSIGARLPGDLTGSPAKTFGKGRRCVGCDGKLSIYNPDDACSSCELEEKIDVGPEEMKAKDAAKLLGVDVRTLRAMADRGEIQVHTKRRGLGTSYVADSVREVARKLAEAEAAATVPGDDLDNAGPPVDDASDPSYFGLSDAVKDEKILCGAEGCAERDCSELCPESDGPRRCPAIVKHPTDSSKDNVQCELSHGHYTLEDATLNPHAALAGNWRWVDECDDAIVDSRGAYIERTGVYDQDLANGDAVAAEAARERADAESDEPCTDECAYEPAQRVYHIECHHHDPELVALEAIGDALGLLDRQGRVRAIAWALDKFDLQANIHPV